ncbi:hypothetical protein I317_06454 [Kwoniella heveanensis CBS 569]|nr:hypothetical protein I317_06454 [Kwoniella heveanensis CBS 569]
MKAILGTLVNYGLILMGVKRSASYLASVQITADATLNCGGSDNRVTSGYVKLPSGDLFFSLFEGRGSARDDGLVIQFEGGPGASGFDYPFIGAGPCQLTPSILDPNDTTLSPSPYPWTDYANLLVLDYPIGTGHSQSAPDPIPPNSSVAAAQDFDDALQSIYATWPRFKQQPLILSSLSYGGTHIPHISSTILGRNNLAIRDWWKVWKATIRARFIKHVDQIILGNPFSDIISEIHHQWDSSCKTEPHMYNDTICSHMRDNLSICQDKLRYLIETGIEDSLELRLDAQETCLGPWSKLRWDAALRNRYDRRLPSCEAKDCHWWLMPLVQLMNSEGMKTILGVPAERIYRYVGPAMLAFAANGDMMQSAYKLLTPVLESGTRLLVYSGLNDTAVPYSGTYSWMTRLPSQHLHQFRQSQPIQVDGRLYNGTVINAGRDYTLLAVAEAGHLVQETHPRLVQAVIKAAVKGQNYDPLAVSD